MPSDWSVPSICWRSSEEIATRLSLECSPLTIATSRLAAPNTFAITCINSSFAAPSTGGDCNRTRRAPSLVPTMPGLLARGTTLTDSWITVVRSVTSESFRVLRRLSPKRLARVVTPARAGQSQQRAEVKIMCEDYMTVFASPGHYHVIACTRITDRGPMNCRPAVLRQNVNPRGRQTDVHDDLDHLAMGISVSSTRQAA